VYQDDDREDAGPGRLEQLDALQRRWPADDVRGGAGFVERHVVAWVVGSAANAGMARQAIATAAPVNRSNLTRVTVFAPKMSATAANGPSLTLTKSAEPECPNAGEIV
jgi:hypothetical protein